MALRERILCLLFLGFCGYLGLEYAAYEYIIRPRMIEHERKQAGQRIHKYRTAVLAEAQSCQKTAQGLIDDGSAQKWLLSDTNPQNAETASGKGVDLICAFDRDGLCRFQSLRMPANPPVSDDELLKCFQDGKNPAAGPDAPNYLRKGIVRTPFGALLCASIPYAAVEDDAGQKGILIVGRFRTKELAGLFAGNLPADFSCTGIDEAGLQSLYKRLHIGSSPPQDRAVFCEVGDNLLQTYLVLADFQGRPALLLRSDSDRDLVTYGREIMYLAAYIRLGAAFPAVLMIAGIVQSLVILPVRRLMQDIIAIGRGEKIRPGHRNCNGEIGKLASEFDRMMNRLEAAKEKLVEKSYISGMAEMSSGVLHNARNALSPLVCGIERLRSQLSLLPFERFHQACGELAAGNVSDDQRHEDLVRFLSLAGEDIVSSTASARGNIDELVKQVGQIEEMLNGQRTFCGVERPLEIAESRTLIEESINLMPAALRDAVRITVDPRIDKLRPIRVHRVVFLQVVENLLINAAESVQRAKPLYAKINVRGAIEEIECIEMLHLEVEDNGAGIEPDRLSAIFEGGVSSKSHGLTGIGLHWCANAISAMKGRIWAHSKGHGRGACFHILLPVSQEREVLTITERSSSNE